MWQDALPKSENGQLVPSDRTKKLRNLFDGRPTVKVFCSQITLEYDLAEASKVSDDGRSMGELLCGQARNI